MGCLFYGELPRGVFFRLDQSAGRSDLGMPSYTVLGEMGPAGKPLTSDQIADLVAYVTSWREPRMEPAVAPLITGGSSP